jgi:hypothetical protein
VPESAEEETGKPVNNGVPELTGAVADVPESAEEETGKPVNDGPGLGAGEAVGAAGVGDCVTGALAMPVAVGAAGET